LPAHPQEWAQQYGLTAFTDGTFQSALDLVRARLNVHKQRGAPHNTQNARLMEGLAALGCEPQAYPTNCDAEACSGYCSLGCRCVEGGCRCGRGGVGSGRTCLLLQPGNAGAGMPARFGCGGTGARPCCCSLPTHSPATPTHTTHRRSGHKQSTDVTFLEDAARAGARVLVGAYAEHVLLGPAPAGGRREARGGKGTGLAAAACRSSGSWQARRQPHGGPLPARHACLPTTPAPGPHPTLTLAGAAPGRARVARGVLASATCPETKRRVRVLVRAAAVVASCGALHTPALLLRSGVTYGGAVGRATCACTPPPCSSRASPGARLGGGAASQGGPGLRGPGRGCRA
jgi:hypothetical protein